MTILSEDNHRLIYRLQRNDTMAELNEEQKAKVKKWLRSIGGIGDGFKWGACQRGRLMEPTSIVVLSDSEQIQVIPLTCGSCGRVTLLDVKSVGL